MNILSSQTVQGTSSTIIVAKWKNVAMGRRLESNKVFWYDEVGERQGILV
jgi:hypothetical protein